MIGARDLPCQEQISRTDPEESLPSVTSSGLIFYFIFFQILFGQAKIIEYILGVSSKDYSSFFANGHCMRCRWRFEKWGHLRIAAAVCVAAVLLSMR